MADHCGSTGSPFSVPEDRAMKSTPGCRSRSTLSRLPAALRRSKVKTLAYCPGAVRSCGSTTRLNQTVRALPAPAPRPRGVDGGSSHTNVQPGGCSVSPLGWPALESYSTGGVKTGVSTDIVCLSRVDASFEAIMAQGGLIVLSTGGRIPIARSPAAGIPGATNCGRTDSTARALDRCVEQARGARNPGTWR
jgi:hypothetical protein